MMSSIYAEQKFKPLRVSLTITVKSLGAMCIPNGMWRN